VSMADEKKKHRNPFARHGNETRAQAFRWGLVETKEGVQRGVQKARETRDKFAKGLDDVRADLRNSGFGQVDFDNVTGGGGAFAIGGEGDALLGGFGGGGFSIGGGGGDALLGGMFGQSQAPARRKAKRKGKK
jgi:hypothetical protein